MQLIALTGGIAAGKSTIGAQLEALGAVRIDADSLAREAVARRSGGLDRVVKRFGPEMLQPDGSLDRAALGALVFGDAQALADLNAIVHPEVRRLAAERIALAEADDPHAVVVYEIPLLAETGAQHDRDWDLIVTAEAPEETRVARMMELRGMTDANARARISAQAPEDLRRQVADVVVDTSGTPADTTAQVAALWRRLGESSSRS